MNKTTKSCSTYLSANLLHRGHCVNRTSLPTPLPLLPLPFVLSSRFASASSLVLASLPLKDSLTLSCRPLKLEVDLEAVFLERLEGAEAGFGFGGSGGGFLWLRLWRTW